MTMGGVQAVPNLTLEMDIAEFDGVKPRVYTLETTWNEEARIRTWWTDFRSRTDIYHLLNCNCSTVVYLALSQVFPDIGDWYTVKEVWTPYDIEKVVQRLVSREYRQMKLSGRMKCVKMTPLLGDSFVHVHYVEPKHMLRNRKSWWSTGLEKKRRFGLLSSFLCCH